MERRLPYGRQDDHRPGEEWISAGLAQQMAGTRRNSRSRGFGHIHSERDGIDARQGCCRDAGRYDLDQPRLLLCLLLYRTGGPALQNQACRSLSGSRSCHRSGDWYNRVCRDGLRRSGSATDSSTGRSRDLSHISGMGCDRYNHAFARPPPINPKNMIAGVDAIAPPLPAAFPSVYLQEQFGPQLRQFYLGIWEKRLDLLLRRRGLDPLLDLTPRKRAGFLGQLPDA
jgi:hypothetical protein